MTTTAAQLGTESCEDDIDWLLVNQLALRLVEMERAGAEFMTEVGRLDRRSIRERALMQFFEAITEVVRPAAADSDSEDSGDRRPSRRGVMGVLQRVWRVVDLHAQRWVAASVAIFRPYGGWLDRSWSYVGLGLTAAMVATWLSGHYVFALGLLTVRLVGSAAAGGPTLSRGTAGVVNIVHCQNIYRQLRGCLVSQTTDSGVLVALALALANHGRSAWSAVLFLATIFSLLGTLSRVAAERSGARITRSVIERFCRTGGVAVALVISALSAGRGIDLGGLNLPAESVIALTYTAYAVVETLRVVQAMREPVPVIAITVAASPRGGRIDGYLSQADRLVDPEPRRGRRVPVLRGNRLIPETASP